MRACEATAPTRIDLAGGTLDIWPLYLLHPGAVTVNVAIERRAWCRIEEAQGGVRLESQDTDAAAEAATIADLVHDHRLALLARVLGAFGIETGVRVLSRSGVPAGSGLGGSSTLAVALAAAAASWNGRSGDIKDAWPLIRDAETQCIGVPTGMQDYLAALYGGALAIEHTPGSPTIRQLAVDLEKLERLLMLVDVGVSRFSGMNNWEIFKQRIEKKSDVVKGLDEITEIAQGMASVAAKGDERMMVALLDREWEARKRLAPEVTTLEIDRVVAAARAHGGAAKVCGAGGGGMVVVMTPPGKRENISAAIATIGFEAQDVRIARTGVSVSKTVI
jgi:D-glycero-alpha-D-manno-heptose-7-phosphate kinase